MLHMYKCQSLNKLTKKHFCMDVVQLWNFLLYNTFIYIFWSIDIVFSNLTKNALKFSKLEKIVLHKFILVAPIMIFEQKTIITFFLHIISLHTLHFHVSYKEVY